MEFKFAIGDYVVLQAHLDLYGLAGSQPMRVAERVSRECEGGVQLSYLCRVVTASRSVWRDSISASFIADNTDGFVSVKQSELTALDVAAYREAIAPKKAER